MSKPVSVSVIIPAYNESRYIRRTVTAVWAIPEVNEVLVVDDGSTDDTALLATQAGARVIKLAQNSGKGGALTRGVAVSTGTVLLFLDGDLGSSAGHARQLLLPILAQQADMTIAKLPLTGKKAGFGLVKGLARAGIRYFTALQVQAPLSGQRALTKTVANKLIPLASGYGVEVGLTIKVARWGYRILEIAVPITHAETGRDLAGFKHRGRQFIHVAKELWRCFWRYKVKARKRM
ncbi:MAG: glycosyltransferase family 2 protein [Desulfotomaculum sp.]|nr:glycosyltransferase family 2 protein [Desulfotomaculum sp.]